MKKYFLFTIAIIFFSSCQNDEVATDSPFEMKSASADYSTYPATVQTVSGDITTNTTWTNDRVWEIDGVVLVKGATLTIESGTFIKAKPRSFGFVTGVLVITKTGKIDAQGTVNEPIIFTSYNLLDGNANTVARPGDFGSVVIFGDALVNTGVFTNYIEGLGDRFRSDLYYGGTNNGHNGGILNYVRIEFPGVYSLQGGISTELSGLTLAGVGSGTFVDHIQVSYGHEDSFNFLGGKVNASHLVSFAADDDSFDFNLGYTGSITKAISIADKNSPHSVIGASPDSNGIELDNNAPGSNNTPITRPTISQLSIIGVASATDGALYENAIHVRRLGEINLTNATITGYNVGIKWEAPSVPSSSVWTALSVHGFINPVLPVGITLGFGSTVSTVNPAPAWGLTQPFFNLPLNFTGATGAFKSEANWTNGWTKFNNF
jgi:hypothetical protein